MERKELIELFKCIERANHPVCNGCPLKYTCDKNQITRCLLGTAADMLEADEQQIAELEKELEIWTARSFEGKIASMAFKNLNLKMEISKLEAQLPKKGEWEITDNRWGCGKYRCSVCNSYEEDKRNFCPNCGAKMKGE
jgi:hypothetical protein